MKYTTSSWLVFVSSMGFTSVSRRVSVRICSFWIMSSPYRLDFGIRCLLCCVFLWTPKFQPLRISVSLAKPKLQYLAQHNVNLRDTIATRSSFPSSNSSHPPRRIVSSSRSTFSIYSPAPLKPRMIAQARWRAKRSRLGRSVWFLLTNWTCLLSFCGCNPEEMNSVLSGDFLKR
jgi:hypothetical protein